MEKREQTGYSLALSRIDDVTRHGKNRMKYYYLSVTIICLTAIFLAMPAAFGSEAKDEPSGYQESKVFRIAMVPFFVGKPDGGVDEAVGQTLNCPVSQLCYEEVNVKSGADKTMTRLVNRELKAEMAEILIPPAEVSPPYDKMMQSGGTDTIRSLAKKLGADLGAQKVIVGIVWRYRDRGEVADSLGTSPASVAFAVYLVDVATGQREWRGVFDKTQRALSEDIAEFRNFFKMGVKWLSAEELARFGVKKVFKTFPYEKILR
jgi:hypothetical protein